MILLIHLKNIQTICMNLKEKIWIKLLIIFILNTAIIAIIGSIFNNNESLDNPFDVLIYVENFVLDVKLNRKIINFGHLATEVEGLCGINQKHIYFKVQIIFE
jgi:hypothetical protein